METITFEGFNGVDCWRPNTEQDIDTADRLLFSIIVLNDCNTVAKFIASQNDDIGAALYLEYGVCKGYCLSEEMYVAIEAALD